MYCNHNIRVDWKLESSTLSPAAAGSKKVADEKIVTKVGWEMMVIHSDRCPYASSYLINSQSRG